MRKNIITTSICLILLASVTFAQPRPKMTKVLKDTISLSDDYYCLSFDLFDQKGKHSTQEFQIFKDGSIKNSFFSKDIKFLDFSTGKEGDTIPYYGKDINYDGIDEVIIHGFTGKGNCCNVYSILSLEESPKTLAQFETEFYDYFELKKVDNDSIPEVLIYDPSFAGWCTLLETSPKPLLVWRWNGVGYEVINKQIPEYITAHITDKTYAKLEKAVAQRNKDYDPKSQYKKFPPPELWTLALDYLYAGMDKKAEEVFENYWPSKIRTKALFLKEFERAYMGGKFHYKLEKSRPRKDSIER